MTFLGIHRKETSTICCSITFFWQAMSIRASYKIYTIFLWDWTAVHWKDGEIGPHCDKAPVHPRALDVLLLLLLSRSAVSDSLQSHGLSMPGFPVLHHLPELAQTQVHSVSDAIQSSRSLSSLYPPIFNISQHQGLFQWVGTSHQVAKVGASASASVFPMNIQG